MEEAKGNITIGITATNQLIAAKPQIFETAEIPAQINGITVCFPLIRMSVIRMSHAQYIGANDAEIKAVDAAIYIASKDQFAQIKQDTKHYLAVIYHPKQPDDIIVKEVKYPIQADNIINILLTNDLLQPLIVAAHKEKQMAAKLIE